MSSLFSEVCKFGIQLRIWVRRLVAHLKSNKAISFTFLWTNIVRDDFCGMKFKIIFSFGIESVMSFCVHSLSYDHNYSSELG